MESTPDLVIHQTLHGYAEGHTLLASSCELSALEKRALLVMSDLSGPNINRAFTSYVTGYPLPGNAYYAFARTWYASEMSRPGCVWTHTLLISLPLLSRIKYPGALNALFNRPAVNEKFGAYSAPIPLAVFSKAGHEWAPIHRVAMQQASTLAIAQHIYEKPLQGIVIPAESAREYEEAILAVWSQQWPRLRRVFSFCTGALSIRKINGLTLDCQVIPDTQRQAVSRRETEPLLVVDLALGLEPSAWSHVLRDANQEDLLAFMYRYGSDVEGRRASFVPLCLAYQLFVAEDSGTVSYDELLLFFNKYFTLPGEAKRLKQDLIFKTLTGNAQNEHALVISLLNSPYVKSLPEIDWELPKRIVNLWQQKLVSVPELSKLVHKLSVATVSGGEAEALTNALPVEAWFSARWAVAVVLEKALALNPRLAQEELVWKSTEAIQRRWFQALLASADIAWKAIIHAMLHVRNGRWADQIVREVGPEVIGVVLEEMAQTNQPLPAEWERAIDLHPAQFFAWFAKQPQQLPYATARMMPLVALERIPLSELPANVILAVAHALAQEPAGVERTQAMSVLLAHGFENSVPGAKQVVRELFQLFHDLAMRNALDPFSWQKVSANRKEPEYVPPSGLFKWFYSQPRPYHAEWDRCGYLRQALVQSWILYKWDEPTFFATVTNKTTYQAIVEYCISFSSGIALLNRLYDHALGAKKGKSFHFTILESYLRKRDELKRKAAKKKK